ncbi:hypothetical protein GRJ2_001766700 [Grus japonensis]|uniref:Uncharacterized protein n=1 Tax=Grus japonensis TaxID=30415 RepID=A0ABC9X7N1_GRUJA
MAPACVSPGKGLSSETNQDKNNGMVYLPSAQRQFFVAVRGAAEQRTALCTTEAPPGAGAPADTGELEASRNLLVK